MPFVPLPLEELDDPLKLADWLEISALVQADSNSSAAELTGALWPTGRFQTKEELDALCGDVFSELGRRSVAGKRAYPFSVDGGVVQLKSKSEGLPYIFCLCLSYFGWTQRKGDQLFPARLFEDLSALAAKNFLQGDSYRFAAPRKDIPGFKHALESVTIRLGEGNGCKQQDVRSAQDDNLDIIAWRQFPDKLPGKLVLFGQCAAGAEWAEDKLMALNPRAFCQYWLEAMPVVEPIKAYFIPHRVDRKLWDRANIFGGIVFDRCRIAYWVRHGKQLKTRDVFMKWIDRTLSSLTS